MVSFLTWDLFSKRVFLRADLNVPLRNGRILDDFRLRSITPTLNALLEKGATVVIATHCGRPTGYDPSLTTRPIAEWFSLQGYNAHFIPYESTGFKLPTESHESKTVYVLDNLRFFQGETMPDELFAHLLKSYADYYVNDAFGVINKNTTSTVLLPHLYARDKRSYGYLIEKELLHLAPLQDESKHIAVIIGGGKQSDKIPPLKRLAQRPHTTLLIGPAIAFTFLKAQGYNVGLSLVDDNMIPLAHQIDHIARQQGTALIYPIDFISLLDDPQGSAVIHTRDSFPPNALGATIGPQTAALFCSSMSTAELIFYTGTMGFSEREDTLISARELITCITQTPAYRVVAGGDSVAFVKKTPQASLINFYSTGGTAALAVFAHEALPGLEGLYL